MQRPVIYFLVDTEDQQAEIIREAWSSGISRTTDVRALLVTEGTSDQATLESLREIRLQGDVQAVDLRPR
jgi:hypothetical protein